MGANAKLERELAARNLAAAAKMSLPDATELVDRVITEFALADPRPAVELLAVSTPQGQHARAIGMWVAGHPTKTIAYSLSIAPSTVREYINRTTRAYRNAGLADTRAELWALLRSDLRPYPKGHTHA